RVAELCQLVDLAVPAAGPSGSRAVNDLAPDGLVTREHTFIWMTNPWTVTVLEHAAELSGDGDGLCEAGERCLVQPNAGGYAGHGALVEHGVGPNGAVLYRYETNGY